MDTTTPTTAQLATLSDTLLDIARDRVTSRIASYRQPHQPARDTDLDELEAVMLEIKRRNLYN